MTCSISCKISSIDFESFSGYHWSNQYVMYNTIVGVYGSIVPKSPIWHVFQSYVGVFSLVVLVV